MTARRQPLTQRTTMTVLEVLEVLEIADKNPSDFSINLSQKHSSTKKPRPAGIITLEQRPRLINTTVTLEPRPRQTNVTITLEPRSRPANVTITIEPVCPFKRSGSSFCCQECLSQILDELDTECPELLDDVFPMNVTF